MQPIRLRPSQKIAIVSLFTALALATNYAMLPLSNIKLMDTIVFVSALIFGLNVGVSVGALTWLVYGTVNPYGSDPGVLLLLLILSETVYAFLGVLARKVSGFTLTSVPEKCLLWGSMGLIGAFAYDLVTNIVPPLISGASLSVALASVLFPATILFMLAHEISDLAFFAIAGPILVQVIVRVMRQTGAGQLKPEHPAMVETGPEPAQVQ